MKLFTSLKRTFGQAPDSGQEESASPQNVQKDDKSLYINLDSLGDGLVAVNDDGKILHINPVAEKMTGYTTEEVKDKPVSDILNMSDVLHRGPLTLSGQSETNELPHWNSEAILVDKDGKDKRVVQNQVPIFDSARRQRGTVFILRDISEEYEYQNQLRQAQKMAAVGTLAGGVAHDFNNLLAGILGNAQLIESGMKPDDPNVPCVAGLIKSAERAAELTQKLLDFSHKGSPEIKDVDVHALINEALNLLEHSITASIDVNCAFSEDTLYVKGDANQLQNVLLNLCLNAFDAMPDGGSLTIKTETTRVDGDVLISSGEPLPPGDYIKIIIADTGVGIPKGLHEEIFKPFFTTKPKGKGTGLGLASTWTCLIEHKGGILVESEVGKGTAFTVLLPAAVNHDEKGKSAAKKGEPIHGKGHILIVDDEDVVCKFGAKALTSLGYEVSTASDGMEGVIAFHKMANKIDMVLLDIVMPKMDGIAAFKRMRELNRKIPVLLCSGFSRPAALDELLEQGAAGFIAKPYRIDELSREIHRIITGGQ